MREESANSVFSYNYLHSKYAFMNEFIPTPFYFLSSPFGQFLHHAYKTFLLCLSFYWNKAK